MDVDRYGDAIEQYTALLKIEPDSLRYPMQLARAFYALREYEAASDYFRQILDDPQAQQQISKQDFVGLLLSGAHNSQQLHRVGNANERYRTALELVSEQLRRDFNDAQSWLSLLYAVSGIDDADESLNAEVRAWVQTIYEERNTVVLEADHKKQRQFTLALVNAFVRLDNREVAESLLVDLLSWNEEDVEAKLKLANLLQENRRFAAAKDHYDKVLELAPYNKRACGCQWPATACNLDKRERPSDFKRRRSNR
jgi:tetratricopeptide (TPR) repeat protein